MKMLNDLEIAEIAEEWKMGLIDDPVLLIKRALIKMVEVNRMPLTIEGLEEAVRQVNVQAKNSKIHHLAAIVNREKGYICEISNIPAEDRVNIIAHLQKNVIEQMVKEKLKEHAEALNEMP